MRNWNSPLLFQGWIYCLVVLFFHLIWENFETEIDAFPPFIFLSDAIGNVLLSVIPLLINPVIDTDIIRQDVSLILPNGLYLSYFFYLSGIKQMCLIICLFIIAQGPWKKKVWFIPAALAVMQITVFVRFFLLSIYCMYQPEQLNLMKDWLFTPLFYAEILIIWMAWVLLVAQTASLRNR
ncbi:MAG: hypothetical protein IH596_08890 [Bacteroidales bacterium]|nr:hypothetical protein [Bacteroidales bacterium]